MIIALVIGFITGWLISMPIGPVNAAAISRTLKHNFKHGIATGLGAALMDMVYCGGAAQIHDFLDQSPIINLLFQAIGFLALAFLGVRALRTALQPSPVVKPGTPDNEQVAEKRMQRLNLQTKSLLTPFLVGVILYASNVAAVPEWIFVSALWRDYGLLEHGFFVNMAFAIGAGLGTAGWFLFLVRYIDKRQRGFQATTLRRINLATAIAMLGFGVYFGYQILFATNWHAVSHSWRINTAGMI